MNTRKFHHHFTLAVALVLVALLAPAAAQAALNTDSASTPAKAKLIRPLNIQPLTALDFGTLIKGSLAGPVSVVLDPENDLPPSISSSNPNAVLPVGGFVDAAFSILGEPGALVQASYPSSIVIKKGAGGSAATEMTIDNLIVDLFQTGGGLDLFNDLTKQFSMPGSGNARLEFGGRLTVEDDDEYGAYSGSLPVTVTYL